MAARRAAPVLGTVWGVALLLRPDALIARVGGRDADPAELSVARVLGARQVVQAVAVARWPATAGRLGAVADALHAASMLALAALSPRYRRVALVSGGAAVLLGAVERQEAQS